ncbi:conserved hypothetical protein [Aeromonas veronii]|uniref:Uncharacterized protein n=1 Tax=Aeromonas veronii TaxID=654 RepID=A0A653L7W7_AERVE|nr:conserved hypothetical protein [Aeromonas veronii]
MMGLNTCLQLGKEWLAGFDDELDLGGALHLALPAIDGGNARQLIDAGGQPLVQQLLAEKVGTGLIWAGAEHHNGVGHKADLHLVGVNRAGALAVSSLSADEGEKSARKSAATIPQRRFK